MAYRINCNRCGAIMSGRTEYDAEVKWGQHECEGLRSTKELSLELLRELAYGRMTEAEAWKIHDAQEGYWRLALEYRLRGINRGRR